MFNNGIFSQIRFNETVFISAYQSMIKVNLGLLLFSYYTLMDTGVYFSLVFSWSCIQLFSAICGQPILLKNLLDNDDLNNLNLSRISILVYLVWSGLFYIFIDKENTNLFFLSFVIALIQAHKMSIYSRLIKQDSAKLLYPIICLVLTTGVIVITLFSVENDSLRVIIFFVASIIDYPVFIIIKSRLLPAEARKKQQNISWKGVIVWGSVLFSANWYMILTVILLQIFSTDSIIIAAVFSISLQVRSVSNVVMSTMSQQLLKVNSNINLIDWKNILSIGKISFMLLLVNLGGVCILYAIDYKPDSNVMPWEGLLIITISSGAFNYYGLLNSLILRKSILTSAKFSLLFLIVSVLPFFFHGDLILKLVFWNFLIIALCLFVTLIVLDKQSSPEENV